MVSSKNTVLKITAPLSGEGKLYIRTEDEQSALKYEILSEGSTVADGEAKLSGLESTVDFKVSSPSLWSVRCPKLYTLKLTLLHGGEAEEITESFGFREISTNGRDILLNGKPFYVRGYIRGIKCHDHPDTCHLGEEGYYRKNILQAKKYGFNFVRFHSTVPSETFFRVADELGMLVHIEIRGEREEYNNLEEMVNNTAELTSVDYARRVTEALYNHPSLAVYCIGNEIKGTKVSDAVQKIRSAVLENDSTRLFLDTCAWGANGRSWVDIDVQHMSYYFPFASHENMFEDTENLLVAGDAEGNTLLEKGENSSVSRELSFNVPLLAHEVGHYTALRDFKALAEKFEKYGTPKPWWVDEELKMIHAKGLDEKFPEMYRASKLFQHASWKRVFEAIRASRLLSGFHFLQFTDTDIYENSNGMVDCFDDECFISPSEVLTFNGDRVLLAKFDSHLINAGEEIHVPISLSNFAETGEAHADFCYTLKSEDGERLAFGEMKNINISRGGLYRICALRIRIPEGLKSQELRLTVKLTSELGIETENYWRLWAFEKQKAETYRDFTEYESGDCVITDDIEKALSKLEEGKRVCLVYRQDYTRHIIHQDMAAPKYALRASWSRFKPVIWDRGTNYGGLCDYKLLRRYGFPSDEYYRENYSAISEDCDKIILDSFPVKPKSIISGIDKSTRDRFDAYAMCFNLPELQYDRTLRDFSYLFELAVGCGKLLITGLNLTALDRSEPSTLAMAAFIKRYLASEDFAPEAKISLDDFRSYLEECAKKPVKERIMTQFWQLDDAPVESAKFWTDSRVYIDDGTWGKNRK